MDRQEKEMIKISVRNLVEFILRKGDLDNRRSAAFDREGIELTYNHLNVHVIPAEKEKKAGTAALEVRDSAGRGAAEGDLPPL